MTKEFKTYSEREKEHWDNLEKWGETPDTKISVTAGSGRMALPVIRMVLPTMNVRFVRLKNWRVSDDFLSNEPRNQDPAPSCLR